MIDVLLYYTLGGLVSIFWVYQLERKADKPITLSRDCLCILALWPLAFIYLIFGEEGFNLPKQLTKERQWFWEKSPLSANYARLLHKEFAEHFFAREKK
jgi:hypothetical protein